MTLLRWALAVFVIVTPLYGMFSGAQAIDEEAAGQGCYHSFSKVKSIIRDTWGLNLTDGMTLQDNRHFTTLQLYNNNGRFYVVGSKLIASKEGSPCVSTDGVGITLSDSTGSIYFIYKNGYISGAGTDGTVLTFPTSAAGR